MPAAIGQGVTLRGLTAEDFSYTWNITGTAGVSPLLNKPTNVGVPVMQDVTAANSAKAVVDGAVIIGNLRSYENRIQEGIVVGAIAHKGVFTWPYTGATPVLGNAVSGSATAGAVKDSGTVANHCKIVEVDTVNLIVTVLFQ